MENLLAIDLYEKTVSWLVLEQDQKALAVTSYGVASLQDMTLAEVLTTKVRARERRWEECRVSLGGTIFSYRNLQLPFADPAKIEKILPLELEELTFYDMALHQFDFLQAGAGEEGAEIVSALIEKRHIAETIDQLALAGLDPAIIGVSGVEMAAVLLSMVGAGKTFVLLDTVVRESTLVLVRDGVIALVRSSVVDAEAIAGFSLSLPDAGVVVTAPGRISEVGRKLVQFVEQTLISIGGSSLLEEDVPCYVNGVVGMYPAVFEILDKGLALDLRACNIAGQPLLRIEPGAGLPWNPAYMNRALALALWNRRCRPIFNFRKGEFKKQPSLKYLGRMAKSAAISLLGVAVVVVAFCWWEYSDLAKRRDALQSQILAVFHAALPEVTRVVNPVQQLQVQINQAQGLSLQSGRDRHNRTKLDLLAELSTRITGNLTIRITRLVADQEEVRITGETDNFQTVDNVKRELEKSDLFRAVTINSANLAPQGGEIRFELKLEFR
ncbi:MAG: GspL/Epsl periplasmic domain-containing protein [Desulfopila sp.]